MKTNQILKLITAIGESVLGIPIFGGFLVITSLYTLLPIMFILHTITLVFSIKEKSSKHGSTLGMITSVMAWIPVLGMILHIATAIVLWITFAEGK